MSAQPAAPPLVPFEMAAVAQSDRGKRVKQRDYLTEGRIPVIDQGQSPVGGYTNDEDFAFIGELPVVLFGDHTRAVKLVDRRFAVGADGIKIFRPAEGVRAKYLYYWMKSAPLPDRGYGRHYQYLRQLSLPLPSPKQQDEIVAEIEMQFSRLDEAVANLKRVNANLQRHHKATVDAAFSGHLFSAAAATPTWQTARQRLPTGWEIANVGRIVKVRGGYAFKSRDYKTNGVPVVRQTDLIGEKVDIAGAKRLPDSFLTEYSAFLVRKGDLLIGMSGSLGKISEYVADEPALQNQRTGLLLVAQGVSAAFARLVLKFVEPQILASGKGVAVQNVSAAQIEAATFPLPPTDKQERIVAEVDRRLSIVHDVASEVESNLARADGLRRSVLARAFAPTGAFAALA